MRWLRWIRWQMLEGWHDLSISAFPSYPPYFHLICGLHLICSFPSRILSIPSTPSAGIRRHLESRALHICHLVHLVHLIYPIPSHLDLGRASRPSHLPSCHLKMEIEIWVFTSFPGRASPQQMPNAQDSRCRRMGETPDARWKRVGNECSDEMAQITWKYVGLRWRLRWMTPRWNFSTLGGARPQLV